MPLSAESPAPLKTTIVFMKKEMRSLENSQGASHAKAQNIRENEPLAALHLRARDFSDISKFKTVLLNRPFAGSAYAGNFRRASQLRKQMPP
jgi:hypothetical protein